MFSDIESALKWAFMMASVDPFDQPAINRLAWKYRGGSSIEFLQGLSREDQIRQAQSIVGVVNEVGKTDIVYKELLYAEFGKRAAIDTLVMRVIGTLGTGVHRRRGIQDLIFKYCGAKVTARKVRSDLRCSSNEVRQYESKLYDVLDRYRTQAIDLVHEELAKKGIIERKLSLVINSK